MRMLLWIVPLLLAAQSKDVSGEWTGVPISLTLKQEGTKLTGTAGQGARDRMPIRNGVIEGERIRFDLGVYHFDLRLGNGEITGERTGEHEPVRVLLKRAQAADAGRPVFEAASVKHAGPPDEKKTGSSMRADPGRVTATNVRLRDLVLRAWNLLDYQLAAPNWLESERYDITATFPAGTPVDRILVMMQNLLVDRFHLQFHREQREMPVYVLLVEKGGPKIKEVAMGGGSTSGSPGRLEAKSTKLSRIAELFSRELGRPVIDETGLNGYYDFTLDYAPERRSEPGKEPPGSDPSGPSIFSAVRDQLGLRLETRKAPVGMFVVDRIERAPTEN